MAIENSYRESEEILKPQHVSEKYHKKYQTIIVTFQSKVLQGLLDNNLVTVIHDRTFGSAHSKNAIYELVDNEGVLFYLSPIGAPITVGILEEIVYAMGIKNIIMYGTCGVLDKNLVEGKIIIPIKAYRDEGTSYHYQEASEFIDVSNESIVANVLDTLNVEYVKGYTWTTDAFYRETKEIFNERKSQGCISVEMEISAVQALSNLRGLNLYTFIYSADNLDSSKWDKRLLGSFTIEDRIKYFMIASEIASTITK